MHATAVVNRNPPHNQLASEILTQLFLNYTNNKAV